MYWRPPRAWITIRGPATMPSSSRSMSQAICAISGGWRPRSRWVSSARSVASRMALEPLRPTAGTSVVGQRDRPFRGRLGRLRVAAGPQRRAGTTPGRRRRCRSPSRPSRTCRSWRRGRSRRRGHQDYREARSGPGPGRPMRTSATVSSQPQRVARREVRHERERSERCCPPTRGIGLASSRCVKR